MLGFAARFRKICKNKTLRLFVIPPKLFFQSHVCMCVGVLVCLCLAEVGHAIHCGCTGHLISYIANEKMPNYKHSHQCSRSLNVTDTYPQTSFRRVSDGSQVIVFMGIAFMVGTESFTMMVSKLGAMPEWSVLAAPASRKVQSILENRAFRGQARHGLEYFL